MTAHATPEVITPTALMPARHDPEHLAVATFLARYKGRTLANYTTDLRDYMRWCRGHDIGMLDVNRGDLELYIRDLEQREVNGHPLAQATVARKFGTVFLFLEYAYIDDRIPRNPAKAVTRPKIDREAQRRTWFELGEIHAIIGQCRRNIVLAEQRLDRAKALPAGYRLTRARRIPDAERAVKRAIRDYTVLQLLSTTGIRVGELCSLDIGSLHVDDGAAYIEYIRKGGRLTQTPLPTETLLVMMRHVEQLDRHIGPLFVTTQGNRFDRKAVQAIITRVSRQVGITRIVTPHGLRRTFASTAQTLGASQTDIQHALNHADPRTTTCTCAGRRAAVCRGCWSLECSPRSSLSACRPRPHRILDAKCHAGLRRQRL